MKIIGRSLAVGLIGFACGCGELADRIKPDSYEEGIAARQVSGSFRGFKADRIIPLGRARLNRKIDLGGKFESYFGVDYNKGEVGAAHPVFEGFGRGSFNGVNTGLKYAPFSKNWGFELGGELFYCEYDMIGGLGEFKQKTSDELFGWGLNAGLFGEIPINDRVSIIGSAGYNFTDNFTRNANVDFDGVYGFVGVKIKLTKEKD